MYIYYNKMNVLFNSQIRKTKQKKTLNCFQSYCNALLLTVLLNALEMILKIMVIALNEWKTQVDAMKKKWIIWKAL